MNAVFQLPQPAELEHQAQMPMRISEYSYFQGRYLFQI
jgi:hypothetical protein